MTDMKLHTRRTYRVFKSLHKPLTYLSVERTLFYLVCVGAVGAFNSILAGVTVFIGGFAADPSELKRQRWAASVTYVFRESVRNAELAVNPLGLTIVHFRADQAFS
jgi:VirB8 protein